MIDLLHPITLAVVVGCVPVAAVTVSGAIDVISHRQHQTGVDHPAGSRSEPPTVDEAQQPAGIGYPVAPHS